MESAEKFTMKLAMFSSKPYDKIWFEPLSLDFNIEITFFETRLEPETVYLARGYDGICAFVNDKLNKPVIDALSDMNIKCILMRCAGFNNVDMEAAKDRIPVYRVPGYSPQSVAEFAMGLALTVNRKYHKAYFRTRDFNMNINGLMGTDFYGKTAGIIGTGRIGQAMINICRGFGMNVIAYDIYKNPELMVDYVSLDELFTKSHLISLHCPLTAETKYIVNEHSLSLMQKDSIIINTSRGRLIKTNDLINALTDNHLGGVGLDVYEEEGNLFYEDNSNEIITDEKLARLMTFPNVIITSHQAYFTREAMEAIALTTLKNAYCAFNNLTSENLLNPL